MAPTCTHCGIATPPITRGFCAQCFTTEADDLPPAERQAVEAKAVAACQKAGLRMSGPDCAIWKIVDGERRWVKNASCSCGKHRRGVVLESGTGRGRKSPTFTRIDEAELVAYFAVRDANPVVFASAKSAKKKKAPAVVVSSKKEEPSWVSDERPNDTHPLCPICGRALGPWHEHSSKERREWAGRHMRSYEVLSGDRVLTVRVFAPTQDPPTRECELLGPCHQSQSVKYTWEYAMIEEVCGGGMRGRVARVLSRMFGDRAAVLEARYAPNEEHGSGCDILRELAGVALLTRAAEQERALLSQSGESTSAREALLRLSRRSLGGGGPGDVEKAIAALHEIRKQAEDLLEEAQRLYARIAYRIGL